MGTDHLGSLRPMKEFQSLLFVNWGITGRFCTGKSHRMIQALTESSGRSFQEGNKGADFPGASGWGLCTSTRGAGAQRLFRERRSRQQGSTMNSRQISEIHSLKKKTRAESERPIQSLVSAAERRDGNCEWESCSEMGTDFWSLINIR